MQIPYHEIHIDTARSGGPGGQNVNKVESKVQLRWNVEASSIFSDQQKVRIRENLLYRINAQGEVMVNVSTERSQKQNRDIAIARLHELVAVALRPKKVRKKTKPTRASKERRLKAKKMQSQKKQMRKVDVDRQ